MDPIFFKVKTSTASDHDSEKERCRVKQCGAGITYTVLGINVTAPLDQQLSALYLALHSSSVKRCVIKLMIIKIRQRH